MFRRCGRQGADTEKRQAQAGHSFDFCQAATAPQKPG
jgi:hypothetical protein